MPKEKKRLRIRAAFVRGLGLIRATLVLLIAALIVLALSLHAGVARADESMMQFGRHLVALSEAGLGRDARGVYLNGQSLGFRVFTSEQNMSTVLDFYESWCRGRAVAGLPLEQDLQGMDQSLALRTSKQERSWRQLTRRSLKDDMGFVACVKHGVVNIDNHQMGARLMAFFETGNLRELGQFHYAAVTRVGDQTRVVAVWTEGDFYPGAMFPATGDAPGFDPEGLSPPPSGRRMLSAGELGQDETLGVYVDCDESIDALSSFYRRDFSARGWRIIADQVEDDSRLFVVQRANAMRVVSIANQQGGALSVTVATTR